VDAPHAGQPGKLDCVGDKVEQDLRDALRVAAHARHLSACGRVRAHDLDARRLGSGPDHAHGRVDQLAQRKRALLHGKIARVEPRKMQHVVGDATLMLGAQVKRRPLRLLLTQLLHARRDLSRCGHWMAGQPCHPALARRAEQVEIVDDAV
jgi:hypothetical protein